MPAALLHADPTLSYATLRSTGFLYITISGYFGSRDGAFASGYEGAAAGRKVLTS